MRSSHASLLYVLSLSFCGWQEVAAQSGEQCESAIAIAPGDSVSSTTVGGVDNGSGADISLVRCSVGGFVSTTGNPGMWYIYDSPTSRDLRLSTCAEETTSTKRITAFSLGSGDCSNRVCLSSAIEEDPECPYENSTVLDLSVASGTTYAFLVNDEFPGGSGDFGFSVTDVTPPPASESCNAATELPNNTTLQGTTVGASLSSGLECGRCIGPQNPGVFFYIPPVTVRSGISISLTGADNLFEIRVFEGPSCEELECKQIDTSTKDLTVYASWVAEKGQDFYLYVSAVTSDEENLTDRFGIVMKQEVAPKGDSSAASFAHIASAMILINLVCLAMML